MFDQFGAAIQQAFQAMSVWELAAVVLGIAYLLLAIRESRWCWYAAFVSTAIFGFIFWDVSLFMESALQVYYLGMAIYGWLAWQPRTNNRDSLSISRWKRSQHLYAIGAILLLTVVSGTLLDHYSTAQLPFLDSFTTWGSVLTTWMVTRKVLENWLYWIVIDGVSIFLYLDRGLYLTALLFMVYLVIVIFGYRKWLHHYRAI